MLLDLAPKYDRFKEAYFVELEGSVDESRCRMTSCFVFKNCRMQRSKNCWVNRCEITFA